VSLRLKHTPFLFFLKRVILEIPDLLSGLALANANCCNGGTQIVAPIVQALGQQLGTAMGVCVTLSQQGRMCQTQDTACHLVLINLLLVNATMELYGMWIDHRHEFSQGI
jgi:hypothetical protein